METLTDVELAEAYAYSGQLDVERDALAELDRRMSVEPATWSNDFSPPHAVCRFWSNGESSRAECTCGWVEYDTIAELFEAWKDHVVGATFGRVSPSHPSIYGVLNDAIYHNPGI